MAENMFIGNTIEEQLGREARDEIDAALERIHRKVDAVRKEGGLPWSGAQLSLYQYLVRQAKEAMFDYIFFLEIDGEEYWREVHHADEPPYAD